MKKIFLILLTIVCINIYAQDDLKEKTEFIFKSGYGYFNDGLMIQGTVLWSEFGIKNKNGYIISLNLKKAETVNDKCVVKLSDNINIEGLNYSYNIYTLYVAYPFSTKNKKHHVLPKVGPYYSTERIMDLNINNLNILDIGIYKYRHIGFSLGLEYQYSINKSLAIGIVSDISIAYQYGAQYLTITPSLNVRF